MIHKIDQNHSFLPHSPDHQEGLTCEQTKKSDLRCSRQTGHTRCPGCLQPCQAHTGLSPTEEETAAEEEDGELRAMLRDIAELGWMDLLLMSWTFLQAVRQGAGGASWDEKKVLSCFVASVCCSVFEVSMQKFCFLIQCMKEWKNG